MLKTEEWVPGSREIARGVGNRFFSFDSMPIVVEGDFSEYLILSLSPTCSWFLLKGTSPVKHANTCPSLNVCLNHIESSGIQTRA